MKQKIKNFMKHILKIIRVKKIILFESNPDFADNTYWLFKYIAETGVFKDYKFVWVLADYRKKKDELCNVPIVCIDHVGKGIEKRIRLIYYRYSAIIIFDCNRCIQKARAEQIRIYLGHGMGIKKVFDYIAEIGKCDAFATMGDGFNRQYDQYVDGAFVPFGLPRNEILTRWSGDTENKFIVWMPTFRQHRNNSENRIENMFALGIPVFKSFDELYAVNDFLKQNNIRLFIRLHPAQDVNVLKIDKLDNILMADDTYLDSIGKSLYEFLASANALITDYSSVYYDFLLTGRPIGLTIEDAKVYSEQWGLWYDDIRHELPGFVIDTYNDLMGFIKTIVDGQDPYKAQRDAICKKFGITPRESSKLIVEYTKQLLH